MRVSKTRLARIIREEIESIISNESPSDVEATADAWAGGENIELPLDHVKAGGGPEPEEADLLRVAEIVQEELTRLYRGKKIKR